MRKLIVILTILAFLLIPVNAFAVFTAVNLGPTTDLQGDVNIPTGSLYYINGVALAVGDITGAAASGANTDITALTGLTTPLAANYGGTGVANDVANTLTFTGAYSLGLTLSANTALTLPTTGTVAVTANKLSVFAATTSAELAGVISDETGTGKLVFNTSPTIFLPVIKGTSASDLPTYSAEFLLATGWTSAGWTGNWADGWTHTTGNTTVLSQSKAAVIDTKYQIAYTVTGRTAGSFYVTFGGVSSERLQDDSGASGTFGPTATSTANLTITPTTDFDGTIVISIKSITAISTPLITYQSSEGTVRTELRANVGTNNTFLGNDAGQYNTTGNHNSAMGQGALKVNTTGDYNSAMGQGALNSNTAGIRNTAIGHLAMRYNDIGSWNSAVGQSALYSNTTGEENTAMGVAALYSNTTGSWNSAVGRGALQYNTTGTHNSAMGMHALYSNTTGTHNSAVGMLAGRYQADGTTGLIPNNSLYLGYGTRGKDNNDDNSIVIGYNAIGIGANSVVLGNDSITKTILKGNVTIARIVQTNTIENTSKLLQTEDIFSDYVVTGLLPATSANLTSDISAGKAYVTGTRINNSATSKTYTASKDTYVDVNSAGTYTFTEVALGADAPAVTADSIRLAKVVTGVDNITGVTDLRVLSLTVTTTELLEVSGPNSARSGIRVATKAIDDYGSFIEFVDGGENPAREGVGLWFESYYKRFEIKGFEAKIILKGGKVGIGTDAPTAVLHLKAGTATASTAPLKLTSGTLLTTPEAGVIEFLTDAYYGTITTGTIRKAFMLGRTTALTSAATIAVNWNNASVFTLTPAENATLNAENGQSGNMYSIVITTSGTTSYTLTFGTAFKTTGTLATGTTDAKVFTINFVYNGTNFNEMSRTTAM